jgi:hypothetical protein
MVQYVADMNKPTRKTYPIHVGARPSYDRVGVRKDLIIEGRAMKTVNGAMRCHGDTVDVPEA